MKRLTELEIRKAAMIKALRTAVRLKFSLMADAAIARDLPDLEERIDNALAAGKPLELNPGSVFDEVTD